MTDGQSIWFTVLIFVMTLCIMRSNKRGAK